MSADRYPIVDQNAPYFLTITVVNWIDIFIRKEYKQIICDSLNYCVQQKGLVIYAWVLMSNHIHLVARVKEPGSLSFVLRDFKKFTSKALIVAIQETGESRRDWLLDKFAFEARRTSRAENFKVWRDDNHAVSLFSPGFTDQKVAYIHDNPVRQQIVTTPEAYLYSSALDYSGKKGLVLVEVL
ncbi:transposase [Nibrella saemangeumensis]|uniref:Transposase n=1 Tax=Nibrella saemangeumensis TaxID=1084526 RepID=A0ABP8NPI3_9BACT